MPLITDSVGRVLGKRYRLVSALGTGASAHVFLAEDVTLQRHVAVKVLQPGLVGDPAFLKRFGAEARSVASLNHPHVLGVYDWGEDPDGPYLVTEYLGGGSLRDLLDRGARLDPAQAARLGAEVAQGLAYAHARGLVHRDIKPANLLFDEDGRVRVADFGVARALAEAAWTEPEGAMVGTARYASPEQAEGRPVDGRADVYSLALVLYEAMTGTVPFVADTTVGTLMARVGASLPPHEALGPLTDVLVRAAAPDRDQRLDAPTLARDLQAVGATLAPPAPLPVGRAQPRVPDDTTRVVPAAGAATAATAAMATGVDRAAGRSGARPAPPVRSGPGEVFDGEAIEGTVVGVATGPVGTPAAVAAAGAGAVAAAGAGAGTGAVAAGARPMPRGRAAAAGAGAVPVVRRRRRRRWPWVALAVVLVLAALAGGGLYAQRVKLFTPSRAVPDVAGLALPAARQALLRDHFAVIVGPPAYSTTVAGGVALRQQPAPGTVEKQGSAVTVVASKGPPPVTVPSLAGLDCGTAQRLLAVSHLVGVCAPGAQAYSATVPAGQVINWAGNGQANPSTAPEGSSIAIAISKGPPPVPVPNVAGASSSYASATAALQGDGLVPVESQQFSTSVPAGQVVGTNPPVGTTVPHGSTVTVVVSDGPPLVAVPDVIGDSAAQAEAALQGAGLAVGSVYGPAGGTVFITDPAIGKSVHEGSTVNLYTQ